MKTQKSPAATGPIRNTQNSNTNKHSCRRETKTERAYMLIISRPGGVTENDILRVCHLASGRNYTNQLEKEAGINLARITEPNPDGIGSHFRYRISSAHDAYQAILVVNIWRVKRGTQSLDDGAIRSLVAPYSGQGGI